MSRGTADPVPAQAVFAPLDAALADLLPITPSDAGADLGAGTVTLSLAERVGQGGRVRAVDGVGRTEPGVWAPTGTVGGVQVGCFPDLYAALAGNPPTRSPRRDRSAPQRRRLDSTGSARDPALMETTIVRGLV